MSTPSPKLVSSARRPLPLLARRDLKIQCVDFQGTHCRVVKDPLALTYYRLVPEQYRLWELLDGRRSLMEIRRELQREFPASELSLADLQVLIADLHERGLVLSDRPDRAPVLLERDRKRRLHAWTGALTNLFFIRLPGWDPSRLLDRFDPLLRWMFSPPALLLSALLVVGAWCLLVLRFADFQRDLPGFAQFFSWPNLMFLWITLGAAKLIHELAHALTCRFFGGECHEIGVAFLVFSPCLYCDVSDAWMLPRKSQRIAIAAAGMLVEVVLSAVALLLWWCTRTGLFHYLCLNLFFVTTLTTVIFNANPLLRYDGYYMLADWLEIPNLRPKADAFLKQTLAWQCLGARLPTGATAPAFGRTAFAAFSLCAAAYRWGLALMMAWFVYWLLKPYGLQNLAWGLAAIGVAAVAARTLAGLISIILQSERINMTRVTCTGLVLGAAVWASLALPLPLRSTAGFTLEPYAVHHIHTAIPGTLTEICVAPGDQVRAGQVLARLADFDKEQKYVALVADRERRRIECRIQHALDAPALETYHDEMLRNTEKELDELESQLCRLTIVAPCDGVVVAPGRIAEPDHDRLKPRLPRWHGSPLEARNIGCYLEARTHLLSIAPARRSQAVLLVDETARADLSPGRQLSLKFESLPLQTFRGEVVRLSQMNVEFAPAALSSRYGGPLATASDDQGRERVQEVTYQAEVLLDGEDIPALSGMRGEARFAAAPQTLGAWTWQQIRRTIHFRM